MAGGAINAGQNIAEGNYLAAAGDVLGVVGGISTFLKACFIAGTPIVAKHGSKPVESFKSYENFGAGWKQLRTDWFGGRNGSPPPRYGNVHASDDVGIHSRMGN